MAISRRNEDRLLDKSEKELVDQTRHPALAGIADKDLSKLVKLLRERRDRARDNFKDPAPQRARKRQCSCQGRRRARQQGKDERPCPGFAAREP